MAKLKQTVKICELSVSPSLQNKMEVLDQLVCYQNEYLRLVEEEEPSHVQVLQDYLDLVESIKSNVRQESMKFAKAIINDSEGRFSNAFVSRSASLYIPVLSLLQMMFRGHRHLASALLLKEKPSAGFCETMREVFDHAMLAHDSLCEDLYPEDEMGNDLRSESSHTLLYGFEEAMLILDISIKWIKSLFEYDSEQKIPKILVKHCPKAAVCMSKCAALINSMDLEVIAHTLNKAQEEEAAVVIQNFWRTILIARRWSKMRKGFKLFQTVYKIRLKEKEVRVLNELEQSEKNFNETLQLIRQGRIETENAYRKLLQLPAKSILVFNKKQQEVTAAEEQPLTDRDAVDASEPDAAIEKAVLVLQYSLRRWLIRRRRKQDWKRALKPGPLLTEEKVARLQDEIDNWQQKNQISCTSSELVELHQKAQSQLSKYCQSFHHTKRMEQKSAVTLAQTKTLISLLETSPTLSGYTEDQWYQYHSLPLHVAIKARLEHQEALKQLKLPSWKRKLMGFG